MDRALVLAALAALLVAGCEAAAPSPPADDDPPIDVGDPGGGDDPGGDADDGAAPGGPCGCDADCAAVDGHEGICVFGVCMPLASAPCSAAGSTAECPAGSRCWGLEGTATSLCWPDCDAHACAGACDDDGSCVPAAGMDCDAACASFCSAPSAPPGDDPADPGAACPDLPPLLCQGGEAHCGQLVPFEPALGPGYENYPIHGETWANQYRSFIRRDLRTLIQYATAKVACLAPDWTSGHGMPLGLGDMSEADGAIPGTSIGQLAHPPGSHVNGHDIDLAYYQRGTADNRLRPICAHHLSGQDAYRCVADPHLLDEWRSALFLGALLEHPDLRVVGIDGRAGPILGSALTALCDDGWVTPTACARASTRLAWETTNTGLGWYHFHHHHMHVSITKQAAAAPAPDAFPAIKAAAPVAAPPCSLEP
jgi:hypothetical protein